LSRRKYADTNRHHIIPKSRGGTNRRNIVVLDERFHAHLHGIAGNLTPEELARFLDIVLTPNTVWNKWDLEALREAIKRGTEGTFRTVRIR